jgi:DNA primase
MKNNKRFKEYKVRLNVINKKLDFVKSFKRILPTLKQIGSSYRCISPFNPTEKTPSFFVNPDKHLWHCFSTNQGGNDIVSFIMKRDEIGFREGLEYIEAKFGLKSKYINKSILKSLIKDLNDKSNKVESGEGSIKRLYEDRLITFMDKFKETIKGNKDGFYNVKEYIFDEFDKTNIRSNKDFERFTKEAYSLLRYFRPHPYGTRKKHKHR